MNYFIENPHEVAVVLMIIGVLWALFKAGYNCAVYTREGSYSFSDITTFLGLVIGVMMLLSNNLAGYIGLIPIGTYILVKIFQNVDFEYSTRKKVKGTVVSGVASAATYMVTHAIIGFGVTEASLSAILAAIVLGIAGFRS